MRASVTKRYLKWGGFTIAGPQAGHSSSDPSGESRCIRSSCRMSGNHMVFLGIDPGLSGALSVLTQEGTLVFLEDTPTLLVGKRREYDRQAIKRILEGLVKSESREVPLLACVELVHAMPGQGVVSMWRMGQGFELWMMAVTMLGIVVETATPQRWKGVMLDGLPKDKDASRYRAKQLWPDQAERFSRKKDDGRAEASLIAEYLRRQWIKR